MAFYTNSTKLIVPHTDPELESYQLMLNNLNVYDDTVN